MSRTRLLASYLKYAGYVMALMFLPAIVWGIMGDSLSTVFAQIGIMVAIAIPIIGIMIAMIGFFINGETKYGIIAIILLVLIFIAIAWRISA